MNRKELTILSIITFITVTVWIILGIYHTKINSSIEGIQHKNTTPLTASFDNDIIKELEKREE